jgi:hypothetical protein
MPLDTAGNKPIIQVTFNTTDSNIYMSCILSFKSKTPNSRWNDLFPSFSNKNSNTHLFTLDPTQPPIIGSSLSDLIGGEIGWVVSVFDLYNPINITFAFKLDIQQSGISIMTAPVNITETNDIVAISPNRDQAIFNGKFKF